MFSRLDNLMLLVGIAAIAAGIYLGVGLPLTLIFVGSFLTWAGIRYQPPGANNG